jgi:hypothetical protein
VERNRPASHGGRQPVRPPPLKPGAPPLDLMGVAMDPLEAGRQVLQGVRRNDLYILSHPEFAPVVRERVTLMLASFSKRPVPKDRALVTQAIIPDIYRAELGKKGLLKKHAPKARSTTRARGSTAAPRRAKARRR